MTPHEIFAKMTAEIDPLLLIVTVCNDGERAGCLIGFGTQCSIHPPRFLACISDKNHTLAVAETADALAVHFVPPEAVALARLFGGETGDEIDKFAHCAWHEGPAGQPILDECGSWFVASVIERRPLGDHVGFLLDPIAAAHDDAQTYARFSRMGPIAPGHPA
jgi:flavin reductase (DIM6/NTAB) family NADH-FMN oxidoreductase RutF